MKRKFLVLTIIFYCVFFGSEISAQAYKSENINFNTYIFPESYIPQKYISYGVKINLSENPIYVIIDGEKKASRDPLRYYPTFFTEKELIGMLIGAEDKAKLHINYAPTILELGFIDVPYEEKNHFIIDVSIKNVAYKADITENKSLETPFTYTIYYSYEKVVKILDSYSKNVVMEKNFSTNNKSLSYSFKGTIEGFKTKPEAVNYLTENIDKGLISNEVINHIKQDFRGDVDFWLDVQYNQDRCFFSRISKEDKHPLFLKLNQDVDALEKWSRDKSEPVFDDALFAANTEFLQKNNITQKNEPVRFNDEKRLRNYEKFLNDKKVFIDFILKMEQYTKELDAKDKGQKAALWACYTNIASSFSVLCKYESSLEYLQKARALDYQERQLKNIEYDVVKRQAKRNLFFDTNGEIKKDVNGEYFKYLKL